MKLKFALLFLCIFTVSKADYFDDIYDFFNPQPKPSEGGDDHGDHGDYYYDYPPFPHKKTPKKPTPTPPTPPPIDINECHDNLGELMDGEGNTLMTNSCEPFVDAEGNQKFKFIVQFLEPYEFNDECLDLSVKFTGTELTQGDAPCDEFSFDGELQQIVWNIKLDDLHDVYNCDFVDGEEAFMWMCDFNVHILFMDMPQQDYQSKIKVTLNRIFDGELVVNVERNIVDGECCINELNIETELRICQDINCDSFFEDGEIFIRKQSIFIEHRIVTPAFQEYYLELFSITLGTFFPSIENLIVEKGRLIIEIKSFIAKPDLLLQIISLLSKTPPNRFLQEIQPEIRNDYKLKGTRYITLVRPENDYVQKKDQQQFVAYTKNMNNKNVQQRPNKNLFVIAMISLGLLGLLIIISIAVYISHRRNRKLREENYRPARTMSQSSGTEQ